MAPNTGLFDASTSTCHNVSVHERNFTAAHSSHGCRHSLEVFLSPGISAVQDVIRKDASQRVINLIWCLCH